jgi:hypothetical protein
MKAVTPYECVTNPSFLECIGEVPVLKVPKVGYKILKGLGKNIHKPVRKISLKGGYYEVEGGMKISKKYYENLWERGRPAPFLQASEVLKSKPKVSLDPKAKPGFKRYEGIGLELIYNPSTKGNMASSTGK